MSFIFFLAISIGSLTIMLIMLAFRSWEIATGRVYVSLATTRNESLVSFILRILFTLEKKMKEGVVLFVRFVQKINIFSFIKRFHFLARKHSLTKGIRGLLPKKREQETPKASPYLKQIAEFKKDLKEQKKD